MSKLQSKLNLCRNITRIESILKFLSKLDQFGYCNSNWIGVKIPLEIVSAIDSWSIEKVIEIESVSRPCSKFHLKSMTFLHMKSNWCGKYKHNKTAVEFIFEIESVLLKLHSNINKNICELLSKSHQHRIFS